MELGRRRTYLRLADPEPGAPRRNSACARSARWVRSRTGSARPSPSWATWGVGLTTVPLEDGDTLGIEYLMVPAGFAETFAIDHANAASWRAQKDQLLAVDSLRLVVTSLQDSILRLEAANARAYQAGYQAAYAGYRDLSRRYVAELKKPRIKLGSAIGLLGAAGVGVVIGRTIRE